MSEIRVKQKTFVVGGIAVFFVLFYLILRDPCENNVKIENVERLPATDSQPRTLPFTVYAITPTYTRPVQKAELTRYVPTSYV